jgi:hypothetical protein
MNDFDARWQQLVSTARAAETRPNEFNEVQCRRLAILGLAAMQRTRSDDTSWRGLVAAAALFFVISVGLAALAATFVDQETAHRWASTFSARELPNTRFIPAPPRPPALASLAPNWSPRAMLIPLDEWFTASSSFPETSP